MDKDTPEERAEVTHQHEIVIAGDLYCDGCDVTVPRGVMEEVFAHLLGGRMVQLRANNAVRAVEFSRGEVVDLDEELREIETAWADHRAQHEREGRGLMYCDLGWCERDDITKLILRVRTADAMLKKGAAA